MPNTKPSVVCLCGSTRFKEQFQALERQLTLAGKIVLSTGGIFGHVEGIDPAGPVKAMLDQLHLHKIDLADEVLVINPSGYIGESTAREIAHARRAGKTICYLEPVEG